MLFTNDIVALDVSSKCIPAMVGVEKSNKFLSVKCEERQTYFGYSEGEWIDIENVKNVSETVLKRVLGSFKGKRKILHVSVPAEFLAVVTKKVDVEYERSKRITDYDVDYLYQKGDDFNESGFRTVSATAIAYSLDGGSWSFEDPRNCFAQKLAVNASYILCEKKYFSVFNEIASRLGFKTVQYHPTPLCEILSVFEKEERFNQQLLVDVGYLSTSVVVFKGDGVQALKSFSYGWAHIAANLYEMLEIPFEDAEEMLKQIDLNLYYEDGEIYTTASGYDIPIAEAVEIARASLNVLVSTVKQAAEECDFMGSSALPVYLTGDAFEQFRGAPKYIERGLMQTVAVVSPKYPSYNKPQFSSCMSLIEVASRTSGASAGRVIYY